MLRDHFTVPKVIQVHLFTFCFALRRVKRPVFCFHCHYALKPRYRPAPGWVVKVCVCYLCVCVCGPTVFNISSYGVIQHA